MEDKEQQALEDGIVFVTNPDNPKEPILEAATVPKFVEHIISERPAPVLVDMFLSCYHLFSTSADILSLVLARYNQADDIGGTKEEQQTARTIKLRVFNLLQKWVVNEWESFQEDRTVIEVTCDFFSRAKPEVMRRNGQMMMRRIMDKWWKSEHRLSCAFSRPNPQPILPNSQKVNSGRWTLLDIHPQEMARQLSLLDWDLYHQIQRRLALQFVRTKEKGGTDVKEDALISYLNHGHRLSNWAASEIVNAEDSSTRLQLLQLFIHIAEHLRKINNFNSMGFILDSLQQLESSGRFSDCWQELDSESRHVFQDSYQFITVRNEAGQLLQYNQALMTTEPPMIPFIKLHLEELELIEKTQDDFYKDPAFDLINIAKFKQLTDSVKRLEMYQYSPYYFTAVPFLVKYLHDSLNK